jgi:alkylated DNA nucleotide flippase Atl1
MVGAMADLLISRVKPGVAEVRSVDPFDTLRLYRIDRSEWKATPTGPGIYLLHGVTGDGKLTVYVGMSQTNIRSRIQSHHVNKGKNWFGVLFAIPVPNQLLCPAIEAKLIAEVIAADVVDVIANEQEEKYQLNTDDVHVGPAVAKIREALQLVLGSDIFTPADRGERQRIDPPVKKVDWHRALEIMVTIPSGHWMSYGDLAVAAGGTIGAGMAMGAYLMKGGEDDDEVAGAGEAVHRVLRNDGSVSPGWQGQIGGPDEVQTVLEGEGLAFLNGKANPDRRWTPSPGSAQSS